MRADLSRGLQKASEGTDRQINVEAQTQTGEQRLAEGQKKTGSDQGAGSRSGSEMGTWLMH